MNDENKKEKMLSIGEVSEYLGVSIDTLRRWEKKGKVKAYRSPGNHRYFKKKDIDNLFGTKYERTKETAPRKTETTTEDIKDKETETERKQKEERIIPKVEIIDRAPRPVNVPTSEPVRIISQERWQSFQMATQSTAAAVNTVSPPPTQSILTPTPPASTATEEKTVPDVKKPQEIQKTTLLNNKLKISLIIVGTVVLLVVAVYLLTRVLFPAKVLSPVPY
jgi:excisionase family DNA binding protein